MSLLRDIQNAAVDTNTDVTTLLRKCTILAARLGNDEFKAWVDRELNGYERIEDLPEYRLLHTASYGDFSGPFGSGLKNAPIPPACLPKELRERATKSYLMQAISAYASLINREEKNNAHEEWPADMVVLCGQNIYRNMNCLNAWKMIPYNALAALIDTIKTRVLNFVLEIEEEAPNAGEAPPHQPPLSQERVSQVFNTYITGNVQNVATGSSHFSQGGEFHVLEGDFSTLAGYLRSLGVPDEDVDELKDAIGSDKKIEGKLTLGKRVQGWLAKMIGKAASGTWQVGASAASTALGKALSKYFGLE